MGSQNCWGLEIPETPLPKTHPNPSILEGPMADLILRVLILAHLIGDRLVPKQPGPLFR